MVTIVLVVPQQKSIFFPLQPSFVCRKDRHAPRIIGEVTVVGTLEIGLKLLALLLKERDVFLLGVAFWIEGFLEKERYTLLVSRLSTVVLLSHLMK
jgi:hypothetical protein